MEKITIEKEAATGLLLKDGTRIFADFIISAADWHYTVFNALGGAYINKKILALANKEKLKVYYSVFFVFLGLNRDFIKFPRLFRFPLETPLFSPDGTEYKRIEVHIHNYDPTLAPDGNTVISVNLYTQNGDYWIRLRATDKEFYNKVKEDLARQVIDILDKKIGGIRENIDQLNIATPATFQRYTNNWQGSIQGWLPGKNMIAPSPIDLQLPGLKNFYFAGHWTIPGGGLPVAVKSARDMAMMILSSNKKEFQDPPNSFRIFIIKPSIIYDQFCFRKIYNLQKSPDIQSC